MERLEFIIEIGKLKRIKRTGWAMAGIPYPESVADHSFRTAVTVAVLSDILIKRGVKVDRGRAVLMALIHDAGEALISDIPAGASRFVKKDERNAAFHVLKGTGYDVLWDEYENGRSTEAKLVKFADRLEMLVQALEYERVGFRGLDEFWDSIENLRSSDLYPYFRDIVERLLEMHREVVGCSRS